VMVVILLLLLRLDLKNKKILFSVENAMLWNQGPGHIKEKGLRLLHGKGMVEGMSNYSLYFDFCEHCLCGKQN